MSSEFTVLSVSMMRIVNLAGITALLYPFQDAGNKASHGRGRLNSGLFFMP
jgi:hypothetical protein